MLAPDIRIGFYQVVAALGAGSMGEVYRARDARLERDVALKILPRQLSSESSSLARVEREARQVAALNHPNIVAIFDTPQQEARADEQRQCECNLTHHERAPRERAVDGCARRAVAQSVDGGWMECAEGGDEPHEHTDQRDETSGKDEDVPSPVVKSRQTIGGTPKTRKYSDVTR